MSLFPLMILLGTAHAIPTQLGHQGRLLDADGLPAEGLHTLDFGLYDAAEEGTLLWSELHEVDLINGYYSLVLGADELDNPLEDTLFEEDELYLELTVDEDEELEPRQALNAVPYARRAGTATNVSGGFVDASEIRVGGTTVVDSSGTWVSSTPDVDWTDLSGIPADFSDGEDANTQLSEEEVDAFCSNNGYAIAVDLSTVATTGSWSDLSDVPADADTQLSEEDVDAFCADNGYALATDLADVATSGRYDDLAGTPAAASPAVGVNSEHFTEDGSFTVPEGITSLMAYVTGGGGGGSNGETRALDLGTHSHLVAAHSHGGGTHTHGNTHEHSIEETCTAASGYGGCTRRHGHDSTAFSGSTGAVDGGATDSTGLTTDGSDAGGSTVTTTGGDGGSGGGISTLLEVSPGTICEILIGSAGDVAAAGASTTVTCGESLRVVCTGGESGEVSGKSGPDGSCSTGGTLLLEYKASSSAPGGGGLGAPLSGASAGQSGSVTIRY